jgi:hypothetical protein
MEQISNMNNFKFKQISKIEQKSEFEQKTKTIFYFEQMWNWTQIENQMINLKFEII